MNQDIVPSETPKHYLLDNVSTTQPFDPIEKFAITHFGKNHPMVRRVRNLARDAQIDILEDVKAIANEYFEDAEQVNPKSLIIYLTDLQQEILRGKE